LLLSFPVVLASFLVTVHILISKIIQLFVFSFNDTCWKHSRRLHAALNASWVVGNFRKSKVGLVDRKLLIGTIKITKDYWHTRVMPAFGLLRQDDCEFKTSLGYLLRHCLKGTEKKKSKGASC
jgi:hypothetical protein